MSDPYLIICNESYCITQMVLQRNWALTQLKSPVSQRYQVVAINTVCDHIPIEVALTPSTCSARFFAYNRSPATRTQGLPSKEQTEGAAERAWCYVVQERNLGYFNSCITTTLLRLVLICWRYSESDQNSLQNVSTIKCILFARYRTVGFAFCHDVESPRTFSRGQPGTQRGDRSGIYLPDHIHNWDYSTQSTPRTATYRRHTRSI